MLLVRVELDRTKGSHRGRMIELQPAGLPVRLVWDKQRTSCWSFGHLDKLLPRSGLIFSSVRGQ